MNSRAALQAGNIMTLYFDGHSAATLAQPHTPIATVAAATTAGRSLAGQIARPSVRAGVVLA